MNSSLKSRYSLVFGNKAICVLLSLWGFVCVLLSGTSLSAASFSDLEEKRKQIDEMKVDYPGREHDIQSLSSFIANGEFEAADLKATTIISQQRNLRSLKQLGQFPEELQQVLTHLKSTVVNYPNRKADMMSVEHHLANGDFRSALYKARQVARQQENLQETQAKGLPQDLKTKLDTIRKEKIEYPVRVTDIEILENYLRNGDYRMALFKSNQIIKKQKNLRSVQTNIPEHIEKLLNNIYETKITYPQRQNDISTMNDYIKNGDFRSGLYKAERIVQKQVNLKKARKSGIPINLKERITVINEERVEYPSRFKDMQAMERFIQNGDFRMALFKANQIVRKQQNLRDAASASKR